MGYCQMFCKMVETGSLQLGFFVCLGSFGGLPKMLAD